MSSRFNLNLKNRYAPAGYEGENYSEYVIPSCGLEDVDKDGFFDDLPDDIIDRKKVAFQDGMGIKSLYEDVVETPKTYYTTQYKNTFA